MLKKKSLRKTTTNKHNSKDRLGKAGFSTAMVVALISVLFSSLSTLIVSKWLERERQEFEIFKEKWVQVTEVINYCGVLQIQELIIIYTRPTIIRYKDQFGRVIKTEYGPVQNLDTTLVKLPMILTDSTTRSQFTGLMDKWLTKAGVLDFQVYRQLVILKKFFIENPLPHTYDPSLILSTAWGDSTISKNYFKLIDDLKRVAEQSLN